MCGPRHHDSTMNLIIKTLCDAGKIEYTQCAFGDQGFVDQWGVFMTREEAMVVALENGQVNATRDDCRVGSRLYSENLY